MEVGEKYFVRIDHRIPENEFRKRDYDEHIEYLKRVSNEREFIGGGFNNVLGGMIIFSAKDMKEARNVADKDPIIKKKLYKYELYEWDIVLASKLNR